SRAYCFLVVLIPPFSCASPAPEVPSHASIWLEPMQKNTLQDSFWRKSPRNWCTFFINRRWHRDCKNANRRARLVAVQRVQQKEILTSISESASRLQCLF